MCGFIAQSVEHCTGILRRSQVRIPLKPWFFSGFFFPIAEIGKFTAMIILHFHSRQCFIGYQKTSNFVKIIHCALYFQLSSGCLDISMKQSLVFDILCPAKTAPSRNHSCASKNTLITVDVWWGKNQKLLLTVVLELTALYSMLLFLQQP